MAPSYVYICWGKEGRWVLAYNDQVGDQVAYNDVINHLYENSHLRNKKGLIMVMWVGGGGGGRGSFNRSWCKVGTYWDFVAVGMFCTGCLVLETSFCILHVLIQSGA